MGFFDKIKNILFEEEEIEIPVITKEEIKTEPEKVITSEEKPVVTPIKREEMVPKMTIPEKKENSFDFPIFDEEEFEENKSRSARTSNVLEYERRKKEERKVDLGRFDIRSNTEVPKKKPFRPSPVISPVYGILDKNYKKEDLIVKDTKKKDTEGSSIDVDTVRKKAFGTLEDDIERTLNEPVKSFYDGPVINEKQTIDELLMENADVTISVEEEENNTIRRDINDILEDRPMIEDALPEEDTQGEKTTLEVLDKVEKNLDEVSEKSKLENDTLESDLFDLIDSMYEQREDGES